MHLKSNERFELRGRFAGFIRTEKGKRRMLVQEGRKEVRVKVPKELRERLSDTLTPGCEIAVTGVKKRKGWFGEVKWVAEAVKLLTAATRPAGAPPTRPACAPTCIRVCAKKNCWKRGGQELWKELERRLESQGLSDAVELKAVGCMDNCKHPPSVECQGKLVPADAEAILRKIAG